MVLNVALDEPPLEEKPRLLRHHRLVRHLTGDRADHGGGEGEGRGAGETARLLEQPPRRRAPGRMWWRDGSRRRRRRAKVLPLGF